MPLFRRRNPGHEWPDPHGRGREADETIGQVLGLPLAGVKPITDILRGPVTDEVCRLLPDAEHSTAARMLLLAGGASAEISTTMVQRLRPDLTPGHAGAAILPGVMLYAVTSELVRRYDVTHPQVPFEEHQDTAPPAITADLQDSYQALQRDTHADSPELTASRDAGAAIAQAALAAIADPLSRSWGGWTLVAAVTAMNAHQHLLPEPGRSRDRPADKQAGAQAAGFAYRLGRSALAATAVVLAGTSPTSA